jgi:flagellar biosynthetic protein FliR
MNPVTGVPVSVIGQFKYMLGLMVFLQVDAHHLMLGAFLQSYQSLPTISTEVAGPIQESLVAMLGQMTLLALQMAAPVAAVSIVVDAALGLVNRAVPQMQVFLVGMPAKTIMGMIALSISIPALVGTVQSGVEVVADGLTLAFREAP